MATKGILRPIGILADLEAGRLNKKNTTQVEVLDRLAP
jgi:hypothetical protein